MNNTVTTLLERVAPSASPDPMTLFRNFWLKAVLGIVLSLAMALVLMATAGVSAGIDFALIILIVTAAATTADGVAILIRLRRR